MINRVFLSLTSVLIALGGFAGTLAAQQTPPAAAPAEQNAAEVYRRAFAALPPPQDVAQMKMLSDAEPLDDAAMAMTARYDNVAKLLTQAAYLTTCDWELDPTKGPALQIPFAEPVRGLSELIALRARAHAQRKDLGKAYDELMALLVLGRQIGKEPFITCKVAECGIMLQSANVAARWLPEASDKVVQAFVIRLALLKPAQPASRAFEVEHNAIADWLALPENADADKLFGPTGPFTPPGGGDDIAKKELSAFRARWADAATREQEIAQVRAIAKSAAAVLNASEADLRAASDAWWKTLNGSGPIARFIAGGKPTTLRLVSNWADAELAMLRTAVAIKLRGASALSASRDPFGDGPFTREESGKGSYVLKSKLVTRDGAVMLKVGG